MKKTALIIIALISLNSIIAQELKGIIGSENWFNNWTNFKPKTTEYADPTQILSGIIDEDLTLYRKNTYLIMNVVYLTNKAKLTIEPGTIIRGDYETCGTLVVTKDAKIIAQGTETDPIIFTSNKGTSERKPGDWGGIILMGDAPINKFGGVGALDFNLNPKYNFYGGLDIESNSGILKYVRIEFSGRKLNELKELNGLALAGVGNKTKLEYIQISYSNDDSFEAYGGEVKFDNLISFRATDDDFDFTLGAQCQINNSIAIRYPFSSDISRSRCFEIDSYDKLENYDVDKKLTKVVAKNITLINNEENNQDLIKEAIYVKNDSFFELSNSVISGFREFIILENKAFTDANLNRLKFKDIVLNDCKQKAKLESKVISDIELEKVFTNSENIKFSNYRREALFIETDVKKKPDFRLNEKNKFSSNLVLN